MFTSKKTNAVTLFLTFASLFTTYGEAVNSMVAFRSLSSINSLDQVSGPWVSYVSFDDFYSWWHDFSLVKSMFDGVDAVPEFTHNKIRVNGVLVSENDQQFLQFTIAGLIEKNQSIKAIKKDKKIELSSENGLILIKSIGNNLVEVTAKKESTVDGIKQVTERSYTKSLLGTINVERAEDPKLVIRDDSSLPELIIRMPFNPAKIPQVTTIRYDESSTHDSSLK